jgi:hypothetical protein
MGLGVAVGTGVTEGVGDGTGVDVSEGVAVAVEVIGGTGVREGVAIGAGDDSPQAATIVARKATLIEKRPRLMVGRRKLGARDQSVEISTFQGAEAGRHDAFDVDAVLPVQVRPRA